MILQTDGIDEIIQNMFDAGFSEKEVLCFCEYRIKQDKKEEMDILEMHRKELLNDIHKIQDNISLLEELTAIVKEGSA